MAGRKRLETKEIRMDLELLLTLGQLPLKRGELDPVARDAWDASVPAHVDNPPGAEGRAVGCGALVAHNTFGQRQTATVNGYLPGGNTVQRAGPSGARTRF
jgi:hypothetical protein